MAGKFINQTYTNTVTDLVAGGIKKYDHSMYAHQDKSPILVTYFNLNDTLSTLDEGARIHHESIGDESPFRYNLIHDAIIYLQGGRIEINLDVGEFGLENDTVEGDAIVLPNTFIPRENDYFLIDHSDKKNLFMVTKVNMDTLDNGGNYYSIHYKLETSERSSKKIYNQVVEEYEMISSNIGTNTKVIVKSTDYKTAQVFDNISTSLKTYFKSLFYQEKVQTFIYLHLNAKFYDPYMIEFIIRNEILSGGDEYTYVCHQTATNATFPIEYDNTFFRALELKNKNKVKSRFVIGKCIDDINSLFNTRKEKYFKVQYSQMSFTEAFQPISAELVDHIQNNIHYEEDSNKIFNIIIDYFNDTPILASDIEDILDTFNYNDNISLFYAIPAIIYIIEDTIRNLLK